jgi:nucleoside-diphosphate-sugar epimerase
MVTGGAGFIGGNFVHFLMDQTDCRVVNLDSLTYAGNLDTLAPLANNPRHCFVHGEIGNAALVEQLLKDFEVDAVVNFAAESHVDRSIDGPTPFITTNVVGTFNLLECARAHWLKRSETARQRFRFLPGSYKRRHPSNPRITDNHMGKKIHRCPTRAPFLKGKGNRIPLVSPGSPCLIAKLSLGPNTP